MFNYPPQVLSIKSTVQDIPDIKLINFITKCRSIIFNQKNNIKIFKLINAKGVIYRLKMKYIKCSNELLLKLINYKAFYLVNNQEQLINEIKNNINNYQYHLVIKPRQYGDSYLMLHIERK